MLQNNYYKIIKYIHTHFSTNNNINFETQRTRQFQLFIIDYRL